MRRLQNFIDGAWVDSASAERLKVVNPATEETLALLPAGSQRDVDAAVGSALLASTTWAELGLEERLARLEQAAAAIETHIDDLARIEATEMGRPVSVGTPWIAAAARSFRRSIELARAYPFVREDESNTVIERRPLGVAALITPWNFPTNVIVAALGPLLAAGNTVVLKPSEKTPMSAVELVEILGLPRGVLNLVLGDARAGVPLSSHPAIGLTRFTGSVPAGKAIAVAAADHVHPVILELGGKDPVIVDADVDVVATARDVARGAFTNTGQICTSMERIYVHRRVADEFVHALVAEAKSYDYGDPATTKAQMGPMVDAGQRSIVAAHVEDAVARGASTRLGGEIPGGPGFYYPATVLTDVTEDMVIMREETFGPVAPVQVVDTFEDALIKAKSTRFGLAATVYSNDPSHIRAARGIPAALIWINRWQGAGTDIVAEPAGQSGLGVMGAAASFDAATRPVTVIHTPAT